jgi:hypothetical protein
MRICNRIGRDERDDLAARRAGVAGPAGGKIVKAKASRQATKMTEQTAAFPHRGTAMA